MRYPQSTFFNFAKSSIYTTPKISILPNDCCFFPIQHTFFDKKQLSNQNNFSFHLTADIFRANGHSCESNIYIISVIFPSHDTTYIFSQISGFSFKKLAEKSKSLRLIQNAEALRLFCCAILSFIFASVTHDMEKKQPPQIEFEYNNTNVTVYHIGIFSYKQGLGKAYSPTRFHADKFELRAKFGPAVESCSFRI